MLTLIIGKHSNLSSALVKKIPNVKLIPDLNYLSSIATNLKILTDKIGRGYLIWKSEINE